MILLDKSIRYAENVINGEEITTWEVRKQCEIFLQDYRNRQYLDNFEFYFDEEKLGVIEGFLSLMNFATGYVAGKPILDNLADFQCFFLANLFGWRYKTKHNVFRYNDITLFIARKNAKTALVGIVFILLMLTEQDYSEFYSISFSKDLASEVRKAITQILGASPSLEKYFTISKTFTGKIVCNLTNSFYQPRTREADANNSIRPSLVLSDEHSIFTDASNFNAMKSGQKNVINPLVIRTTTAYALSNSIMIEDLEYIRNVLKGVITNERQFALVYYAEKEHFWDDIGLYQANPLRIEENYNTMREDREIALAKPSTKTEFITKTLNNFLDMSQEDGYMDISRYKKCIVNEPPIDIHGKDVFIGIDNASKLDIFAVSFHVPFIRETDKKLCVYTFSYGFVPNEEAIYYHVRNDRVSFDEWFRQGIIQHTNSQIINSEYVLEFVMEKIKEFRFNNPCFIIDPSNSRDIEQFLTDKGFNVIELWQSAKHLSIPTKELRDYTYEGRVYYQENPCLDWMMGNSYIVTDTQGNIKIDKKKQKRRIDMVDSNIFAAKMSFMWKPKIDFNAKLLSGNWSC